MAFYQRDGIFSVTKSGIHWRYGEEQVIIDAWSEHAVRIRATINAEYQSQLWALEEDYTAKKQGTVQDGAGIVENGRIKAVIDKQGTIRVFNSWSGQLLLEEIVSPRAYADYGRQYLRKGGERFKASVHFLTPEDERFYGLGQHQHGYLNQKGISIALEQKNTEVAVPFLVSSRGYGFLWNNPAVGRVDLLRDRTSWYAERTQVIDYVVFAADQPSELLEMYADSTGHTPMMPDYGAGFWQCKLRYQTQEELLAVAREHKRRGLPMSVIVADFFHWTRMGEWKFDEQAWPDPDAMIKELKELGIELMVSVWPAVNPNSEHFSVMKDRQMLVDTERGIPALLDFEDTGSDRVVQFHYYDPSSEDACDLVWSAVKKHYYDKGISIFWLDACEPETRPFHPDNMRIQLGNMEEVGCIYPMLIHKLFYRGMSNAGQERILNLTRSAWAGSQRFGAALWSGDIDSTFEALRKQVPAGLNVSMSGIPWWTTDIGGFFGGNTQDPQFRELMVRWFQYALFCPIFRLHGFRDSWNFKEGGPNEVWSFGERAYQIISRLLHLREHLKPYIMEQMECAHATGLPPMRPLFVDFPEDTDAWKVEDQFLFGPDILVAPVLHAGAEKRKVYLPAGPRWRWAWSEGQQYRGGQIVEVDAPLEVIPVFIKEGSQVVFPGDNV